MTARHVVLLSYGEPPDPSFGAQLRYSWRILRTLTRTIARIPAPLLPVIALARARTRHAAWTRERYRSPLEALTRAQAAALADRLAREDGPPWRVHVAWEFRDPSLGQVLDAIPDDEPIDVVPMYATDSDFTHGLARRAVAAWRASRPGRAAPVRVRGALGASALAGVWAAHVRGQLAARGLRDGADRALVLAAHGTLLEPPPGIDGGRDAAEQLCVALARLLAPEFGLVTNGWLNHARGGRWTEPSMAEALAGARQAGYRRVVYLPFGFLADNAESQLEGRIALRAAGLEAVHLPCLNEAPALVDLLAATLTGERAASAPAIARAG